jgi:hypothetical protein
VVGSCKYGHETSGFIKGRETGFETRTKQCDGDDIQI